MKPVTPEMRDKLLTNLKSMREVIIKQRALALQVLEHPDATANEIMYLHESMVRTHQGYRKVWASVREVLVPRVTEYELRYGVASKIERLKL